MFYIHLPHRNQRYECAFGIQPNQRQMRLDEYAFGIRHDLSGADMRFSKASERRNVYS